MFRFDVEECSVNDELARFASIPPIQSPDGGQARQVRQRPPDGCADEGDKCFRDNSDDESNKGIDKDADEDLEIEVAYLYEVQVSARHQRIGLGAKLVQALEDMAGEAGMAKVVLTVFLANKDAVSFYKRLKSVSEASRARWWQRR